MAPAQGAAGLLAATALGHYALAMGERTTTMAGITGLLSYAASRGLDVKELCEATGLDAALFGDPLQPVPFTLTRRLWCTVIGRLPHENVGVGGGTMWRTEHMGYAGMLLVQASSALEMVQLSVEATPLSDTALVDEPVILREHQDQIEIRLPPILSAGIPERTEAAFLSMLTTLRRLAIPDLCASAVRVAHAYDKKRALAEPHFGCTIKWSAGEDVLCFAREPLTKPLPNSNPRAAEQFRALIAQRLQQRDGQSFMERVHQVVRQQVLRGNVAQQEAATMLGVSVRSLQRKLSQRGLSYGDLASAALESRAHDLLRNCAYSLEEVALQLGYSELGSFSRFWKRRIGETPARYRARLLGS